MEEEVNTKGTRLSGFALLTPEQRKAVARKGGIKAQALGVAHRFTSKEASAAGKIGGRGNSIKRLSQIGQIGGLQAAANRKKEKRKRANSPLTPDDV